MSYDLLLDVDFGKSFLRGEVAIEVEGAGGRISLDAVDLKVTRVTVDGQTSRFKADSRSGKLVISGVREKSLLRVSYTKQVSDESIFGLYKSKYGRDHLLVTDLEPAQARTVFPCLDEPSYKAVFRLTVVTDGSLSVLSNMPLASRTNLLQGRAEFKFVPSRRMSTYLFFLGIGRFEEAEQEADGTEVIVASRPDQVVHARLALDLASAVLKENERYFGIRYPLPKLHLVALPEYHTGAMENWGAITSREAYLLLGEDPSPAELHRSAHLISHEIAHQWFGDLVTMTWWDDLWLNESFATFMDYKMVEKLYPEWDSWREFLRLDTFRAQNADGLAGTHPIQVRVKTVDEIEGIFDEISYGKGASVLRMLESYIGETSFRRGVSAYLRRFGYSNARGKDLWNSLENASRLPVSRIARAWITKPGFPLVRVNISKGGVTLTQERFRLVERRDSTIWPIPLTVEVGGNRQTRLLDRRSVSLKVRGQSSVIVNPRREGFYSVLYDGEGYDRLGKEFPALHPHDRPAIVNDLYLFMQAGMVEPELYFRFVALCGDHLDPSTSQAITDQLVNLRAIADDSSIVRRGYSEFYRSQISKVGLSARHGEEEKIGEVRETVSIEHARSDKDFARSLSSRFDVYESVEPALKTAVAISFAVTQGEPAFGRLADIVKKTKSEVERGRLYAALTSLADPALVERALELPMSGEVSRSDSAYTLSGASRNPKSQDALWKWIVKRYDRLHDIYGGSQQFYLFMNAYLPRCGIGHEAEVRKFISGKRYKKGETTFKRTLELLKVNSSLRKRLLRLA